ncbi:unnamed protein product [Prorocentrum cordatum]|uniref:Uncharacterized protein n=1 Tax=Prorocentrum cordatum TaxID=2364126 RepID=A0ABN9TBG2_9DINO|nr:unnamed protein product [Polarella glacialis]
MSATFASHTFSALGGDKAQIAIIDAYAGDEQGVMRIKVAGGGGAQARLNQRLGAAELRPGSAVTLRAPTTSAWRTGPRGASKLPRSTPTRAPLSSCCASGPTRSPRRSSSGQRARTGPTSPTAQRGRSPTITAAVRSGRASAWPQLRRGPSSLPSPAPPRERSPCGGRGARCEQEVAMFYHCRSLPDLSASIAGRTCACTVLFFQIGRPPSWCSCPRCSSPFSSSPACSYLLVPEEPIPAPT